MRTLYLECNAGVSGDMLLGALADLLDNPSEIKQMIESAGIPGIEIKVFTKEVNHINGNKVEVLVHGHPEGEHHGHSHSHRTLVDVLDVINGLKLPDTVKQHAMKIYEDIAKAESEVHHESVGEVHFHEVGMLDAIVDIVGVCLLIHKLAPDIV
ncbi:MAG: DUF111 family protein, partial [Candidatus Methanomethylophilaceae archaeon]|nr:DUF111 family protein [Candidatus Methanomethylophilaceae archaeon]